MRKLNMRKEVFYLIGSLRDTNFDIREGKNYELRIYQKNNNWLDELSKITLENLEKNQKSQIIY